MARYTGPTTKKARAFGDSIFGFDKSFERRKYPPGQHGLTRKKKAGSNYAQQLSEKQKAKYTYGVLERQFRRTFHEATRKHGVTGEVLLQLLEARLDNTVYRLGISPTRRGARQLVGHRHITVNGQVVIRPMMYVALSYDHRIIDGRESVGFLVRVKELLENPALMLFGKDPVKSLLEL